MSKKDENVFDKKAIECSPAKKKKDLYYIHVAIGLGLMAIFWTLPPIAPITPIGMKCVGAFLGMVYLWSAVEALWPSLLGLFMLAISGYGMKEGMTPLQGFNDVWLNAVGVNTVLLTMFCMILFGAMDEVGDTTYIAKWFLTKKIFKGRPYVFLAMFYVTCFVLSALISPITSLILLWPIAIRLMNTLNVERCDAIWKWFFVGMFLVSTLGQPFFPFMGAQLIPTSAFAGMTAQMGHAMEIPMLAHMTVNIVMTTLIMAVYLLIMKFILRIDVSKLKAVDPEQIEVQMPLPPMNFQQKAYLFMLPCFLLMMLLPNFFKGNVIADFFNMLGPMGVPVLWIIIFLIIRWNGKPLLDFKEVAYKQFNWGIFFMIAAAVYAANTLSNPATGVSDFLIQALTPVLGGKTEMVFVAIMFTVALIITNFANNAAMAVVLMPVVLNFSAQINISPIPVAMGVILMVFVAMLTPAASPHAGMMYGRRDLYSTKDILSIGLPMCAITLVMYIFIGYPLAKILVGA